MLHSTRSSWSLCSCLRSTDLLSLFPELPELWSKMVLPTRSLSLSVLLPMTPDYSTFQRPLLLLWDSPLVPELESPRLVVNASLWTNWLSELQRVKTLWSWEVQETPEKPLDTSVWVHTRVRLQESCPRAESSNVPEVDVDLRVSRSKQIYLYNYFTFKSCIVNLIRCKPFFYIIREILSSSLI